MVRQTVQYDGRQYGGDRKDKTTLVEEQGRRRHRQIDEDEVADKVIILGTGNADMQISQSLDQEASPCDSSASCRQNRQEKQRISKRRKIENVPTEMENNGFQDIRRWTKASSAS